MITKATQYQMKKSARSPPRRKMFLSLDLLIRPSYPVIQQVMLQVRIQKVMPVTHQMRRIALKVRRRMKMKSLLY